MQVAKTEINPGEIYVTLRPPASGKISFESLGIPEEGLELKSGLLRLVIDVPGPRNYTYYKVPTAELRYAEDTSGVHWQCEYNGHTILDKLYHHGRSTILLMKRTELGLFENRMDNKLIVHAEFEQPVHILGNESFIYLFN